MCNPICYQQSVPGIEGLGADEGSKNEMRTYGIDYLKEWVHLEGKEKLTAAVTSM